MRKKLKTLFILFVSISFTGIAQDNCYVFKLEGDSCRYKACQYMEEAPGYFQLTKEYHEIKDRALEICPEYATPYRNKSTAYLKTGDFINWKILIDKAVKLDPIANLDYRGWCRFQFFNDYQGAIDDIEQLSKLVKYDLGHCQNGYYHLQVARGLCYKMLGQKEKALKIITDQLELDPTGVGLYDYLHVGVLYLELNKPTLAIDAFESQSEEYAFAENDFYRALAHKKLGQTKEYEQYLRSAHTRYLDSNDMFDVYTHQVDKVFLGDIEDEMKKSNIQ